MSPRLPIALAALTLSVACTPVIGFETGEVLPEFSLEDVNISSATYGDFITPSYFRGQSSAWYFGHAS